jgi:sugar/nucleoside kinase (ribokinase family)
MSPRSILIVGSMAFDDLEFPRPITDPSSPEPEPRTSFRDVVGGSATYASLCASCFAPVRVVAVVGEDFPEPTLEAMRARGIDTQGIERAAGSTFRWSGRYREDLVARDTLDTQLNVFAKFEPKLPPSYRDSAVVLLGNIHPVLQLQVLDQLDTPSTVIADTMNFWISGEAAALARLLRRVDVLVINDEEARLLSGIHNITRAARDILARGPRRLIIKRGEYGSLYFDADGVFAAPALPLETIADPTGAGDSFAGGMAGYLASRDSIGHHTMRHAIVHGTATASFCVEALGTTGVATLCRDHVTERVSSVRKLYDLSIDPG